jgi:Tfp pilus assembly protein PilV
MIMKTALLVLAGTAVALAAMPADAQRYSNQAACSQMRQGRCVASNRMSRADARRSAAYRVGYAFGPNYSYNAFAALPRPVVTQYRLRPNFRYVQRSGYVYVVNPRTYRVVRVIAAS